MKPKHLIDISTIPEEERTPLVLLLFSVIESLQEQLSSQSKQLENVVNELKRIKKLNIKPEIKPSKLPKNSGDDDLPPSPNKDTSKKRAGSYKRKKNQSLKVTHEEVVRAKDVPKGARQKGYKDFFVQELVIKPVVIKYRLERWQLPNGNYHTAKLPSAQAGNHFGPTLRAYVLHQYHHQCVTQPLLLDQLIEWGIDISKGQLNRILTEDKSAFHKEKEDILTAGLAVSKYINVDDTGARHKGSNGVCTHIGNELFAWFKSTKRKNRINFLQLLRNSSTEYCLTDDAFSYMKRYKVTQWVCDKLESFRNHRFTDESAFTKCLESLEITNKYYVRLVTEAALIGAIFNHGFSKDLVIVSDDAGQFNVFVHALCWIHAERGVTSLIPANDIQVEETKWALNQFWDIYHLLLDFKKTPEQQLKDRIDKKFTDFCKTKTRYLSLNLVLKRLYLNRDELLMVLSHPHIPLHNNLSERDIREYVKRRKISGSTRSDNGQLCRDTFASLKKTAKKLSIAFWYYLLDRISLKNEIPMLSNLIEKAAAN